MDKFSKEKRSEIMKKVKQKDTSIELQLRKTLWNAGYHYRKNYKDLPGKPDIVLTKYRIAIFCDSEFFHGKDWEILKPQLLRGSRPEYWINKIDRTRARDDEINKKLLFMGWTVIRFWGNDIMKRPDECLKVIEETIFDQKVEDKYMEDFNGGF